MSFVQIDDFRQRRIDVLGIVQGVSLDISTTGTQYPIFTTGSVAYPSPSRRTVVLLVEIETQPANALLAPSTNILVGSLSGGIVLANFIQADLNVWSAAGFPYIISQNVGVSLNMAALPVWGAGVVFTFQNNSLASNPGVTAQVTAYGWSS